MVSSKKKEYKKVTTVPGTDIPIMEGLVPLLCSVGEVTPDQANPRRLLNLDALRNSLKRFGLRKPIVVNARDKIIEAGHQTYAALIALGAQQVPVVWADDDRIEATAYNIADNRTAEVVAEWDEEALAKLMRVLDEEDATFGLGYDQSQIDGLLSAFENDEAPPVDLPKTPFDEDGTDKFMANRIIIIYETPEQKLALQELLGFEFKRIMYTYEETEQLRFGDQSDA